MPGQLVVSGLTKVYSKNVRAVDDLSFTVQPGRVTGFLGPNGSGKTTTLRMVLNLVRPTAGTATIDGSRYVDLSNPLGVVGSVLEASNAHKGRTGHNHLRVVCAANGYPMRRADEVLDLVGLGPAARRKVRGYSLGMRQRLGIATAMVGDPSVLILDEPANGLDPEGIRWLREFLRGFVTNGRTVFVSSHLLGEMEQIADDVVIIAGGKLIATGRLADVIGALSTTATIRVRTPRPDVLTAELTRAGATVNPNDNGALLVTGVDAAAVWHCSVAAGTELHELVEERPDLEQAYLELTEGKAGIR
jgi:ABC-2 type transport system ATP-binding protein